MFEVLTYLYQNYDVGQSCPEAKQLEKQLISSGFDSDEIDDALIWLHAVDQAAVPAESHATLMAPHPRSCRIYPRHEQAHLGPQAIGFLTFMENAGTLSPSIREIIIDRALAVPGGPVALDDLKIIMWMVFWRLNQTPDALTLDELCVDSASRITH